MTRKSLGLIASEFRPGVGGMENYAAELAKCFRDMGLEVHLFLKETGEPIDGVTAHRILTMDLNRDLPRLCEHDMDRWLSMNSSYGMLARHKPDVYVCAHGNDFLSPWVTYQFPWLDQRAIWRLRKPLEQAYFRRMRRKHLHRVSGVFNCSEYTRERFLEMFSELAPKVHVIKPGVGQDFFQSPEPGMNDEYRLVSVARLDNARKNIDGVIRALADLKEKYAFRYSIIGDGQFRPALERLVRETGLEDRVQLRGRVSYPELREAYRAADLFVLTPWTSDEDIEGFGMVYLEANASGVPVLASRGNGSSSAVAEGVSGFFVDDPTPEGCRQALESFFDGAIRFEKEAVIGHADGFRWPKVAQKFVTAMGIAG